MRGLFLAAVFVAVASATCSTHLRLVSLTPNNGGTACTAAPTQLGWLDFNPFATLPGTQDTCVAACLAEESCTGIVHDPKYRECRLVLDESQAMACFGNPETSFTAAAGDWTVISRDCFASGCLDKGLLHLPAAL
jgi:hypothetical protein